MKIKIRLSELQKLNLDLEVEVDLNISKYNRNSFAPDSLAHMALKSNISPDNFKRILLEYKKINKRDDITESLMEEKIIYYLGKYWGQSSTVPKIVNSYTEYTKETVQRNPKLFGSILKGCDNYYNFRDLMLKSALRLAKSDSEYLKILETFRLALDTNSYRTIISYIPDGKDNPKVKNILCGNKLEIFLCETDKEKFKHITKYPSCVKYLDKPINVSYKDLEEIPPATRFKFLEMYYTWDFGLLKSTYFDRVVVEKRKRDGRDKLILPRLSDTEIDLLLFSVSMNKASNVSFFLEKYKTFREKTSKLKNVCIT